MCSIQAERMRPFDFSACGRIFNSRFLTERRGLSDALVDFVAQDFTQCRCLFWRHKVAGLLKDALITNRKSSQMLINGFLSSPERRVPITGNTACQFIGFGFNNLEQAIVLFVIELAGAEFAV